MIELKADYSRGVLVQLMIATVLTAGAIYWARDFIYDFYLRDQATLLGIVLNGAIIALFFIGLFKVVANLLRYAREESIVRRFGRALEEGQPNPATNIDTRSVIHRRYYSIVKLSRMNAPVNHSALASMLLASESRRLSLPRFITNILILNGVFGTIVGLSIALLGASDLLKSVENLGGMNVVIHGMATALSTTLTAIVCYLFLGYFYLKLVDIQTQFVAAVEQVTTLYLLPRFARQPENLMLEVSGLVRDLRQVAESMKATQADYTEAGLRLRETVADYAEAGYRLNDTVTGLEVNFERIAHDIEQIKTSLREGFRLAYKEAS